MDEIALVSAARKGDLDAFNRLVLDYQQQVFNLALRMLNNPDAAEDATQLAFISVYRNLRGFRRGYFRAWILRIVTNKCYDELRRRHRQPIQPLEPVQQESGEEIENPAWLQDQGLSPQEIAEQKELDKVVQDCIEDLPPEFRAVVLLVDVQDMDYKEASRILQKPLGTIKSRLARARRKLQDCLKGFRELLPAKFRLNSEGSR
ncbi:MAG TPA: sigma-70 family RNA polymerase sigma factor [Anaerolineae bacterium]|nr:sigma-70 family RNA polymerase sigma factor [Anaerolineae bacterium]